MGKWWVHYTGARVGIMNGKGHAPSRKVEYACFWAGWCRVTITEATVYIEGGDLREVHACLFHLNAFYGDQRILCDLTHHSRHTQKWEYRRDLGAWYREMSRGREPKIVRVRKTGMGRAGWDYSPHPGWRDTRELPGEGR